MQTPDPIFELLNREIPEKLWHYTSLSAFHGIVTSRRIYATDLRFLNDREEFTHAREIADNLIAETPEVGPNSFPVKQFLEKATNLAFNTGRLHPGRLQVFVASFTAVEDSLSQWRAYSRDSSGAGLAFDAAAFRPPPESGTLVSFAPCVYDLDTKKRLIEHALHHFVDEMSYSWTAKLQWAIEQLRAPFPSGGLQLPNDPEFDGRVQIALSRTQADLLRIAALLKNSSFREENEWRLVLPVFAEKELLQTPRLFRTGRTTLIPYVAYPFSSNPDETLPLTDLILGPGSDAHSVSAAQSFLLSHGIRVMPRESKVPYRPW